MRSPSEFGGTDDRVATRRQHDSGEHEFCQALSGILSKQPLLNSKILNLQTPVRFPVAPPAIIR